MSVCTFVCVAGRQAGRQKARKMQEQQAAAAVLFGLAGATYSPLFSTLLSHGTAAKKNVQQGVSQLLYRLEGRLCGGQVYTGNYGMTF